MMERKGLQLLGLAAVIAIVAVTVVLGRELTTTSAAAEPAMELTVSDPAGVCEGEKCTLDTGVSFTLQVNATKIPSTNYIGMQTFIDYGSDLVYTKGTVSDEITWPDGGALSLRGQTGATFVNHSDLTGFVPPLTESTHLGSLVELDFTCSAGNSSTVVELIPFNDPRAAGDGAAYIDPDGVNQHPTEDTLTINCGAAPVDTPTATATETPTGPTDTPAPATDTPTMAPATDTPTTAPATDTPTPTVTPELELGDVDCNGMVNSIDALWVLWLVADITETVPCPEVADVDESGMVDSLDSLFILWIELNLV